MGAARDLTGAARSRRTPPVRWRASVTSRSTTSGRLPMRSRRRGAAAPEEEAEQAGRRECSWQRDQLHTNIRALVLEDQRRRLETVGWSSTSSSGA